MTQYDQLKITHFYETTGQIMETFTDNKCFESLHVIALEDYCQRVE